MADDHLNPPGQSHVMLGSIASVHDMATAAARRCSGRHAQQDQYDITVRDIGGAILDGLPAFYRAANGSLERLTADHKYWVQLLAYLEGNRTRTEGYSIWNWIGDRTTYHTKEVAINRNWIKQVIIKKGDYAKYLRDQNEPMPEWWPAPIKADGAHSGKRTGAANATREAGKKDRLEDLGQFIDDVYAALEKEGNALLDNSGRKPLPVSPEVLHKLFCVRHRAHRKSLATFTDDLHTIGVQIMPGQKRYTVDSLTDLVAGKF